MYSSRLEWYQHELEEHRVEWSCNTSGHDPYRSQHEFEQHMAKYHASSMSNDHLSSLVHNFRRPLIQEGTQCPLCGNIPTNIQNHLARHQAQLALFAIPRRYYTGGGSEIDSTASGHCIAHSSNTATPVTASAQEKSEIRNSDRDLDIKSSRALSDTLPETIQIVIPDCEDEDWNLPTNPDGTKHWLNTGDGVGHQQGQSSKQTRISEPTRVSDDWATFFKITRDQIEGRAKREIEYQSILHEIISTEEIYMDYLDILCTLYRDDLASWQPPIFTKVKTASFIAAVFGKVDAIKDVNRDHLLAPLKYRHREQGPWVIGFSDIFREWIRKAFKAYVEYAAGFPHAIYLIRKEANRNTQFRDFLDQADNNERSSRLGWNTFLKQPITRLQRYSLMLETAHIQLSRDTEEKANLSVAIKEIKAITFSCDANIGNQSKKVELLELQSKLILRPGMEHVELNLDHLGRELFFRGVLARAGGNRFGWIDAFVFLFDHYLVITKRVAKPESSTGMQNEVYDMSRLVSSESYLDIAIIIPLAHSPFASGSRKHR
jgi:hypothetical protein